MLCIYHCTSVIVTAPGVLDLLCHGVIICSLSRYLSLRVCRTCYSSYHSRPYRFDEGELLCIHMCMYLPGKRSCLFNCVKVTNPIYQDFTRLVGSCLVNLEWILYSCTYVCIALLEKSVWIREHWETQSGEESSSSGRFNPVDRCQQHTPESKRIFPTTIGNIAVQNP